MELDALFIHVPKLNGYYDLFGKHMYCTFIPMGLFAVADFAQSQGHKVEILHLGLEKIKDKNFSLREYLYEKKPKVIGMSLHWHHQSYDVVETARSIRLFSPHTFIVLGGLTASFFHSEIIKEYSFIDAVIRGDAELAFTDLLKNRLQKNKELKEIPNLTWRQEGKVTENPIEYVCEEKDLERFNFTNLRLLRNYELYIKYARDPFIWVEGFNRRLNSAVLDKLSYFPLSLMRGCEVNCSFCSGGKTANDKINNRSNQVFLPVKKAVDSIEELKTYGYDAFFIDFLDKNSYFEELINEIKRRKIITGCIAAFRNLPGKEILSAFAGAFRLDKSKIFLSPETYSERLRQLNKGYYFSNDDLLETVEACVKIGIRTEIYFLLGLPFENAKQIKKNRDFQRLLEKRFGKKISVFTDFLILEPGSPMYLNPEKFGIVKNLGCFDDYYRIHSPEESFYWPNPGFYPVNLEKSGLSKVLEKPALFKKELKKIYCRDFCKLASFLKKIFIFRSESAIWSGFLLIISRLVCKTLSVYWKLKYCRVYSSNKEIN